MTNRDNLPWALPAAIFRADGTVRRYAGGEVVPSHEAEAMFADHFDPAASYVSDGRFVRRVIGTEEARQRDLNWTYSGERCDRCGCISIRKLRSEPRGSECLSCRASKRRRYAA